MFGATIPMGTNLKTNFSSGSNFGIGNIDPPKPLTVEGDISASGTIYGNSGSFNYITASVVDVVSERYDSQERKKKEPKKGFVPFVKKGNGDTEPVKAGSGFVIPKYSITV